MLTTKKWVALRLTVLGATLGVVLLAGCAPPGPRALLDGERLVREGRYDQAIERLGTATQLLPQNAQAWNYLGLAYHRAGQFDLAARAYQQALACDLNLAAPRFNLGCLYAEQNNLAAAIPELTSYTLLQPQAIEGWLQLGLAHLRARQLAAAEKSFNHVRQIDPRNAEALNDLGLIQLERNRPRDAYLYFNAALQQQPRYAPALLNLAIVSDRHLKNREFALKKYREYLALTPRPPGWAEVDQLARELAMALNPPPPLTPGNVPVPAPSTTQPSTALSNPAPPPTNRPVTLAQTPLPAPPSTPGAARTPPPREPNRQPAPPANRNTAAKSEPVVPLEIVNLPNEPPIKPPTEVGPDQKSPPPAETQAGSSTAADLDRFNPPSRVTPLSEKPGVLSRLDPRRWFRRSAKPRSPVPAPSLSASRLDRPVAESSAPPPAPSPAPPARYSYQSPSRPAAGDRAQAQGYFARGAAAQRESRLDAAVEAYQKAVDLDPAFFEARYNLGLAAYDAGKLPLSLSAYETALAIRPDSVDARYNFALALDRANYPADAAGELEQVLAQQPGEARAHLTLGNLYARSLAQPRQARAHYLRVLALDPGNPQATAIRYWLAANPP